MTKIPDLGNDWWQRIVTPPMIVEEFKEFVRRSVAENDKGVAVKGRDIASGGAA